MLIKSFDKVLKIHEEGVKSLKTKVSSHKCLENLFEDKNRHLVNLNLGQQDKRSTLRQLYYFDKMTQNYYKMICINVKKKLKEQYYE